MGYRIKEHKKPEPRRTLVDTTTPSKIYVHNGTIAHLAFPCWYQEVHKPAPVHHHAKHRHDHEGWPSPGHPDHVCQLWTPDLHCCSIGMRHECSPHCKHYIDLDGIHPIHLLSEYEGYLGAYAVLNASDDVPDTTKLNITAEIDPKDDWIVRVTVDAYNADALYEPVVYKMTVFVYSNDRRDIVALTDLVILPSGYQIEFS